MKKLLTATGLCLLLAPCAAEAQPVQASPRLQVNVMGGALFSDDDEEALGTVEPMAMVSIQRSLGPLGGRLVVATSLLGAIRCPPPPNALGRWNIQSGRVIDGIFDLTASVALGNVRVEPFVGAGLRGMGEGEIEDGQDPDAFATESNVRSLLTFGGSLYVRLAGRIDGVVQVRGARHFLGDQTLTRFDGTEVERDLGDADTLALLAGLAFRL